MQSSVREPRIGVGVGLGVEDIVLVFLVLDGWQDGGWYWKLGLGMKEDLVVETLLYMQRVSASRRHERSRYRRDIGKHCCVISCRPPGRHRTGD